jgi:putrescine transport system substrate-binding protein
MFFDNFAIPKDAGNVDGAHAFIDYMLRPDVAAKNSNFLGYANGNLASQPLLDKAVFNDRTVYPDAETMNKLYVITAHDQKTQRVINRLWTKVKTGR